jgi:hypothetical protein
LTSGPVADRVVEGTVVGVVVEGTVVGVVDAAGGLDSPVLGAEDVLLGLDEVGEPVVADAEGSPPRMGRVAFV